MTITDSFLLFFSDKLVTSFEKSPFQFFFVYFPKLFYLSPSKLNKDITTSHEGPEQKVKGDHRKHGTFQSQRIGKEKQNQLHVYDVGRTKQRRRGEERGAQ